MQERGKRHETLINRKAPLSSRAFNGLTPVKFVDDKVGEALYGDIYKIPAVSLLTLDSFCDLG